MAARRGMTLVEVALAAAIMAILLGLVAMAVERSNGAYRASMTAAASHASAQRALERVAREFMDADRSSLVLTPAAPFPATAVEFARAEGFDGNELIVGPRRRIELRLDAAELDDGIDNDHDGRVDEGAVVLVSDTSVVGAPAVVLVQDVSKLLDGEQRNGLDDNGNGLVDEPGFTLTYDAQTATVTLRLTVQKVAHGGDVVNRTAESAIRIRND